MAQIVEDRGLQTVRQAPRTIQNVVILPTQIAQEIEYGFLGDTCRQLIDHQSGDLSLDAYPIDRG
jgi:hypothetical protein